MKSIFIALTAFLSANAIAFSADDQTKPACERQRESMRLISHAALQEVRLQTALLVACNEDDSEDCKKRTGNTANIIVAATEVCAEVENMLDAEATEECPAAIDAWLNEKSRLVRTLAGPSNESAK